MPKRARRILEVLPRIPLDNMPFSLVFFNGECGICGGPLKWKPLPGVLPTPAWSFTCCEHLYRMGINTVAVSVEEIQSTK